GCTFQPEPFWNREYCFWDTVGLGEGEQGTVKHKDAVEMLKNLLVSTQGFHACIFVSGWSGVGQKLTIENHQLFYDTILEKKIPLLFCITGKKLSEDMSGDYFASWLKEQKIPFHTDRNLVVFSSSLDTISQRLQKKHKTANNKSKKDILEFLSEIPDRAYIPYSAKQIIKAKLIRYIERFDEDFGKNNPNLEPYEMNNLNTIKWGFHFKPRAV
ncbi:MAG: hypothetical protein HYX60_02945, partial [Legionella longbeachae]|nr:hypothetical protein [Legionella longbeachae]